MKAVDTVVVAIKVDADDDVVGCKTRVSLGVCD